MHRLSVVSIALLAGAVCISAQVALRSYGDETYALKVGIGKDAKGNSNQEFYLSVDAFGSETRVAGVDCWQCCEKRRYDASLSNTNKNSCKAHSPDGADGTKTDDCTDSFQSAIANFPSLPFTEVTSSPIGSSFVASPSDGVAGLSGAVYGYYFTRTCSNDGANGGTINLNALDNANCGAASATVTLTQDANKVLSTALTQFKIDADTAVPSPTGTGQWLATFSTTSPYVVVPQNKNHENAELRGWSPLPAQPCTDGP
ncbi:hypothetical protein AAVH_21029 [Aphelenchoides avenae]|nr:hypothetical protein AAVH_21029 [Aphelenchus avenae]